MEYLKGKKSYIVACLLIAVGVVKIVTGDATGWEAIMQNIDVILAGTGVAAIKAAVVKGPA